MLKRQLLLQLQKVIKNDKKSAETTGASLEHNALGRFSTMFNEGDTVCDFLFGFLHNKPLLLERGLL